jgi:hypothetical protein
MLNFDIDNFRELVELYSKNTNDVIVRYKIIRFVKKYYDIDKFNQIKKKYIIDSAALNTIHSKKYFDEKYILEKLRHVIALGLHKKESCNILDLGSGFGWFSLICKLFGHTTYCLDAPPPISAQFYSESIELFGLQRILHTIRPFQPLPAMPMKFDVVVALQVCFNLYENHFCWEVGEWSYLINNLEKQCCNKNFVFYIEFNWHKSDRYHGLRYSDIMKQWLEENNFKFNDKIAFYKSCDKAPMQHWMEKYEKSKNE